MTGRGDPFSDPPMTERPDGRAPDRLREISAELGYQEWAEGSVLFSQGKTRLIASASVGEDPPRWLRGTGRGWVTAEYAMLPASTGARKERDSRRGRPDGRAVEIQRLIGRALRAVVDLEALGERALYVDCDVLQADGGTRCAAITGGWVALRLATAKLLEQGAVVRDPITGSVAAVSCGVVDGEVLCDLDYAEDSGAEVDANIVMSGDGGLVEVQATAEQTPVSRASLDELLGLAEPAIARLRDAQASACESAPIAVPS
jgi:ribonuclease PH